MPTEVYEVVAQGARYWFLFLMALIVWRSYRWYRRDRRQRKKRLRLLPDAGFVGELVVVDGGGVLKDGSALSVPREGTLGFSRTNDICVPVDGVAGKHLWFCFDDDNGLMIEPYGRKPVAVDGEPFKSRREPLYMSHGSRLVVGEAKLRLRLFAGFETAAGNRAASRGFEGEGEGEGSAMPAMTAQQYAAYQQWMRQAMAQQAAQPAAMTREQYAAYQQQWMQQAMAQQAVYQQWAQANGDVSENDEYDEAYDDEASAESDELQDEYSQDAYAYHPADDISEKNSLDTSDANSTQAARADDTPVNEGDAAWPYAPNPYEPREADAEADDFFDDLPPEDDDLTDAVLPPRSAYIGTDDAEIAKKKVWDRYLGGGRKR